ncbi:MAG: zinc ribbon domain-containing protein [Clostridiales bacterium]|nr:zinc ribbon domain-containing protein [Clostridiales bacterium]
MEYCSKCGAKRNGSQQTCSSCGHPFSSNESDAGRRIVYNGVLQKCPNCGEPTNPFSKFCDACGYEFRDADSTSSVSVFSDKYQSLDSNAKRVDLIRTFTIPNTKTDILEFFILATSNIVAPSYADVTSSNMKDMSVMDVSEAWAAKLQQLESKAELVLSGDSLLENIKETNIEKQKLVQQYRRIYDKKIQKAQHRVLRRVINIIAVVVMCHLIIFASIFLVKHISNAAREKALKQKETELSAVVEEIEELIEKGDYVAALNKTELVYLHDSRYIESEKKWENTRKELVLRIIQTQDASLEEKIILIETLIELGEFELAMQMADELKPLNSSNDATKLKWEEIRESLRLKIIDAREFSQGKIKIPDIAYQGMHYLKVKEAYEAAGFLNVTTEKASDTLFGWVHNVGEAFEVSIDGSTDFAPGEYADMHVPIIIKYHGKIFDKGDQD